VAAHGGGEAAAAFCSVRVHVVQADELGLAGHLPTGDDGSIGFAAQCHGVVRHRRGTQPFGVGLPLRGG
jgi:hypothetical protein